jgi:dienelactone hydrolase
VLRHRGSEPRPWLVCIHGFGMGKPMMDFTAFKVRRLHRDLGLNLVLPVLPTHGPRASGGFSGTEMMGFDLINAVHGLTQAVWDIRRLITWVRAQGATSVGLYGISLGGYTTALTAGIEDDLDLAIAAIPPSDLPALVAHHAPASLRRRAQRYRILGEHASHLHRVVSPLASPPRCPAGVVTSWPASATGCPPPSRPTGSGSTGTAPTWGGTPGTTSGSSGRARPSSSSPTRSPPPASGPPPLPAVVT